MNANETKAVLIELRNLKTYFFLPEGTVRAVDDLSLTIRNRQTMGVIGESGCGKSVTAQSILRIVPSPPAKIVGGEIIYYRSERRAADGELAAEIDLARLDPFGEEIRRIRGGEISMIFQEPMTSFGPLHTVGNQIMEAIRLHQHVGDREARERTIQMLRLVGIPKPEATVDAYPHQLSGGQRQRAMIAMALSCKPSLLIADEPTTALDVTIQAQILELLRRLQDELGMAIMFITHNLGVIAEIADEVAVMYLGKIVEQGSVLAIFDNALHPYTRGLLTSMPLIEGDKPARLATIDGVVPDPYEIPAGCAFSDRCPKFMPEVCDQAVPALVEIEKGHFVRCFLYSGATDTPSGQEVQSARRQEPTPQT
jgi:oligopeptide/dipeptide ABC transporter ATP-binding protein